MGNERKGGILASGPNRLPAVETREGLREMVGGPGVSDAELLRDAGRDPDAFRDLYERYSEQILGYFRRRTADPDTALELTAETFSRAWVTRERFDSLPLSQREALRLRIVDELTYDEVADALGTTRSTARMRVHRALAALRNQFTDHKEDRR